ncbi:MAG: hypothetical protein WDN02_06355 [Methylovirgula sp.]|uniref:hypothetical protein n=1 Tax=Methylovirgula sp. TaxID=1978224 RepID=UPI00307609DD
MSKEAVTAASKHLIEDYNLRPGIAIVVARAGPDDIIHVFTVKGKERFMPKLPDTFEGFPITQSKCDPPRFLAA